MLLSHAYCLPDVNIKMDNDTLNVDKDTKSTSSRPKNQKENHQKIFFRYENMAKKRHVFMQFELYSL